MQPELTASAYAEDGYVVVRDAFRETGAQDQDVAAPLVREAALQRAGFDWRIGVRGR